MIRSLFARGAAALAAVLLVGVSPALADITVKDGASSTQNVATNFVGGHHFYGFTPANVAGTFVNPATEDTLLLLKNGVLPTSGAPTAGIRSFDSVGTGITSTAGANGHVGFDVNVLNPAGGSSAASSYFAETTAALAAGSTYTGTARDAGVTPSTWAFFTCSATSDQASAVNGLRAQTSPDASTWTTYSAGSLSAGGVASAVVPVNDRYARCVLVNGATAEGSLTIKSRFTIAAAN